MNRDKVMRGYCCRWRLLPCKKFSLNNKLLCCTDPIHWRPKGKALCRNTEQTEQVESSNRNDNILEMWHPLVHKLNIFSDPLLLNLWHFRWLNHLSSSETETFGNLEIILSKCFLKENEKELTDDGHEGVKVADVEAFTSHVDEELDYSCSVLLLHGLWTKWAKIKELHQLSGVSALSGKCVCWDSGSFRNCVLLLQYLQKLCKFVVLCGTLDVDCKMTNIHQFQLP